MTEIESELHADLGFIVSGVQIQFTVFIQDKRHTRAVMPARQTDIQMWALLLKKQQEILELKSDIEHLKEEAKLFRIKIDEADKLLVKEWQK